MTSHNAKLHLHSSRLLRHHSHIMIVLNSCALSLWSLHFRFHFIFYAFLLPVFSHKHALKDYAQKYA